ncbi:hypothetical protein BK120_33815 [Paenibacillus sp. FSL A5-0031]|uniref:hypothetical protein n=1 Tax=Paenibacillus sp. FSL A5-0031 TaxID=1920420 RepID=UPI00096C8940|nr:hypothetical protein [Paenibacillus sp. FSL A5-0031]OME69783.1 hypothetical protein BK120_33815 [Paenibacillus sp. FSL A5-0031]
MSVTEKQDNRGGARIGAGRKKGIKKRKRQISLFLTYQQWELLEMVATAEDSKLGTFINKREEAFANEIINRFKLELENHNKLNINSE